MRKMEANKIMEREVFSSLSKEKEGLGCPAEGAVKKGAL